MARRKVSKLAEEAPGQGLLSLAQAAAALKVSRSTLTRWLSEGRLRGFKVGRQWRFKPEDLDKFSQMVHPSAAAVKVVELQAATAGLRVPSPDLETVCTDPALPNYPTTQEEIAVDGLFLGLLVNAANVRASDVHLEAAQEGCVIRTRIDGVLHETARLPRSAHRALATCAKYHAGIPVDQPTVNHDGMFQLQLAQRQFVVRVATVPAVYGDSVVVRLLAQGQEFAPDFERMGLLEENAARYLRALRLPSGLVIASGPSGSGKTTVLYSGLRQIANPEIKTLTVEDPIVGVIPWVTQVPVNRKAGMTYESVVRAFMRQDPDVILVGAINSLEVGEACLQAAVTGHLVLSTLHANSAAAAITRMLDMGLESFLIADSLVCVFSVRLARRVCSHCAEPDQPPFALLSPFAEKARAGGYALPDGAQFVRGKGCNHCRGTGHRGRIGLFEVMEIDHDLSRLIMERAPAKALQETAVKKGMTTLAADGLRKAVAGITSVFEAARVTHTTEW